MSGTTKPEAGPNWFAVGATALTIAACYGTILVVAALVSLGVVVTIHGGGWAGAVSLVAVLALVGVLLGQRRHHAPARRPPLPQEPLPCSGQCSGTFTG